MAWSTSGDEGKGVALEGCGMKAPEGSMKFSDLNVSAVGHSVMLVGGIWAGDGHAYLCYFPEYGREFDPVTVEMNAKDWEALLRQSDLVETEVLAKAEDGSTVKAVIRKCQRAIDGQVQWAVWRRDGFRCCYCGRDDVPLTVDHLVLWEEGGPSTEDNLVSACKKCNKTRGRTQYLDWLHHPYYMRVSAGLSADVRKANVLLADTLADIPRMVHVRSR
jgi:hypothetical protein